MIIHHTFIQTPLNKNPLTQSPISPPFEHSLEALQKRLLSDLSEPILELGTPFFKTLDLRQFQNLTLKYWQLYQLVAEQAEVKQDGNLERMC